MSLRSCKWEYNKQRTWNWSSLLPHHIDISYCLFRFISPFELYSSLENSHWRSWSSYHISSSCVSHASWKHPHLCWLKLKILEENKKTDYGDKVYVESYYRNIIHASYELVLTKTMFKELAVEHSQLLNLVCDMIRKQFMLHLIQ